MIYISINFLDTFSVLLFVKKWKVYHQPSLLRLCTCPVLTIPELSQALGKSHLSGKTVGMVKLISYEMLKEYHMIDPLVGSYEPWKVCV